MLGSRILYLKGMRILMFQLSGFYYSRFKTVGSVNPSSVCRSVNLPIDLSVYLPARICIMYTEKYT